MEKFRYIDGAAILKYDREKCVGCGTCETVCPHRVFTINSKKAKVVDYNGCMECGACAKNCPVDAIYVNPDDGCGCAAYIINSWISKVRGKTVNVCGC